MPTEKQACIRCGGKMILGLLIDRAEGNKRMQPHWVEGAPERGWITGNLKIKDRRVFAVESYRCDRCGWLESYATGDSTLGRRG